jgi:DNA-binding NarL/FixJ family response regulator
MTIESPQMDTKMGDRVETIRVMLVDDREAMREGLRLMLSGDESIRVVGTARNGQEAIARAKKISPDIILMDIAVPGVDGIEAVRSIKESQPQVSVIVISDNRKYLAPAIQAGAVGFLARNIGRSELVAAIRLIYLWRLVLFDENGAHFALVRL